MFTSKFAPLFFVSSILLVLILQIYEIVEQKERGTIGLLTLSGLRYADYLVFWMEHVIESCGIHTIH